jgi:ubiquinol-cytochrome c reductase cytochrome c subunit
MKLIIRKRLAPFLASYLVAASTAGALAAPATLVRGSAEAGRAVYMAKNCYFCHGTLGQGAMATGVRLAPDPIPATAIRAYVRHPRGQMPAYSPEVLSDEDIDAIYAYLASLPSGRPSSEIPLLGVAAPGKPGAK